MHTPYTRLLVIVLGLLLAQPAGAARRTSTAKAPKVAAVRVRAHTVRTTRGTRYVQASHRSRPNSRKNDNFGTKGNRNPYSGKKGARARSTKG